MVCFQSRIVHCKDGKATSLRVSLERPGEPRWPHLLEDGGASSLRAGPLRRHAVSPSSEEGAGCRGTREMDGMWFAPSEDG